MTGLLRSQDHETNVVQSENRGQLFGYEPTATIRTFPRFALAYLYGWGRLWTEEVFKDVFCGFLGCLFFDLVTLWHSESFPSVGSV